MKKTLLIASCATCFTLFADNPETETKPPVEERFFALETNDAEPKETKPPAAKLISIQTTSETADAPETDEPEEATNNEEEEALKASDEDSQETEESNEEVSEDDTEECAACGDESDDESSKKPTAEEGFIAQEESDSDETDEDNKTDVEENETVSSSDEDENEDSVESENNECCVDNFNFHDILKKGVKTALSQWSIDQFLDLGDVLFDNEIFLAFEQEKKSACLKRYYAFAAASTILIDESSDPSEGLIEDLRVALESNYSVNIDPINSLSIENKNREDVAYTLFMANVLSIIPSKELFKMSHHDFEKLGLGTKHDFRALDASIRLVSFIALKNAEALVKNDDEAIRELRIVSRKLHKGKVNTCITANVINKVLSK